MWGAVLEANAGYYQEETLTNSAGQTFEEELTWGVDSLIKVESNHVAEAQLVVNAKKRSGDFIIVSRIWGPVFVNFTYIRENNTQLKATCTGQDIYEILKASYKRSKEKEMSMTLWL